MSPNKEASTEGGLTGGAVAPSKISMKGFSFNAKAPSKPISFATRPAKPSSPSTTLGKRPRSALHAGSDDEDEDDHHGRHEEVTGFDIRAGGAVKKSDEQRRPAANEPLVIPRQKSRNFREEIRRARGAKNLLPPEVQEQMRRQAEQGKNGAKGEQTPEQFQEEAPKWGLTITKKVEDAVNGNGDQAENVNGDNAVEVEVSATTTIAPSEDAIDQAPPQEKTDDELALEALLGKNTNSKKGPDLIITRNDSDYEQHQDDDRPPLNETDSYRRAIAAAPDVSTLEDYERVPVEEFGAALLRGMGWKGPDAKDKNGSSSSNRPKEVKRRQNLLGLGAKELKEAEELGAWVHHSDTKRLNTGSGGSKRSGERRPRANEYREREERRREDRDERHGSYRRERERERDDYRERERDRDRDRRRY